MLFYTTKICYTINRKIGGNLYEEENKKISKQ